MWKFVVALAVLVLPCSVSAANLDLGLVGQSYPVKERDALEEVESRAKQVDWQKMTSTAKPEDYRPENLGRLPRAGKASSRLVDMSYTLDADIPDGKGGILYPKGYTFNPLDYVPVTKTIVVVNGEDRDQVAWFVSSPYAKRIDVMLLTTGGSYSELGKRLHRPIFYLTDPIVKRFQLKAVPSVVKQEGRAMKVDEIHVKKAKK